MFDAHPTWRLGRALTVALPLMLAVACWPKPSITPTLYEPTYTYEPTVRTGGNGVSIALIEPTWPDLTPGQKLTDQDADYARAILSSTTRMLTGAGISVSGPFKAVDDMTFPEKQQADLVLTIGIHTAFTAPAMQKSFTTNWLSAMVVGSGAVTTWYSANGNCSTATTVDLVFWESLSRQRMWAKTVTADGEAMPCSLEKNNNGAAYAIFATNEYRLAMHEGFPDVMAGIERYLDPTEVALVKSQSLELRDKKVY